MNYANFLLTRHDAAALNGELSSLQDTDKSADGIQLGSGSEFDHVMHIKGDANDSVHLGSDWAKVEVNDQEVH